MDGVDSREGFAFECGTCDLTDDSLPSKGNTKAPRGRAACSRECSKSRTVDATPSVSAWSTSSCRCRSRRPCARFRG